MSWSQARLEALIKDQTEWNVEQEESCLSITNDEGLTAFAYLGEQQIVVELALFPASLVADQAALNDLILRSHSLLPLTAICIKPIGRSDYYVAFGALSTDSKEAVLIEEIDALFANTEEFLELYGEFAKQEKQA